eukprot:67308_1
MGNYVQSLESYWYQSETENVSYLETYEKLLRMGFDEAIALKASKIHQKDINKAIEYIRQNTPISAQQTVQKMKQQKGPPRWEMKQNRHQSHAEQCKKQQKSKPKIAPQPAESKKDAPNTHDQGDKCNGDASSCGMIKTLMTVIRRNAHLVNVDAGTHRLNEDLNYLRGDFMDLLNMYHHVLSKHNNPEDFAYIYDNFFGKNGTPCVLNKCRINRRNRNIKGRKRNAFDVDDALVPLQQVLDAIHCHFAHSYDSGYRQDKFKKKQPKVSDDDSKQSHNKFTTNLGKSIHDTSGNTALFNRLSNGGRMPYSLHISLKYCSSHDNKSSIAISSSMNFCLNLLNLCFVNQSPISTSVPPSPPPSTPMVSAGASMMMDY